MLYGVDYSTHLMCYNHYISMSYAHFAYSFYSQFTAKISFEHSVAGYITLLCITIT